MASRSTDPRAEVKQLAAELTSVTERRLAEIFKDPAKCDEAKYRILAQTIAKIRSDDWKDDPTKALILAVKRAVKELPREYPENGHRTWRSQLTWREIGEILCGFCRDLPPRADGEPPKYGYYVHEARVRSGYAASGLSDSTFQRSVAAPFRLLLAHALLDLAEHPDADREELSAGLPLPDAPGQPSAPTAPPTPTPSPPVVVQMSVSEHPSTATPAVVVPRLYASPELARAADQLATVVRDLWRKEIKARSAHDAYAIPVRWVTGPDELMDHWANVRRTTGQAEPLPLDNDLTHVVDTYLSVPSGRLVFLGRPGSGKTVLAISLVLDLLDQGFPHSHGQVPVIFGLSSWQPDRLSVRDWMTQQLVTVYGTKHQTAEELVQAGCIMPVLDGFDEITPDQRADALRILNRSLGQYDRFVLTSRDEEYAAAVTARGEVLAAAAVVEVQDLTIADLQDYLPRTTKSAKWDAVLHRLGSDPDAPGVGQLAAVLSTPIAVSLARTIYSEPGNDPAELLNAETFPDPYSIVDHLIDEFCTTVYCHPPLDRKDQRREFSCSLTQARKWLGCVATVLHAHETYDLPAYVMSNFGVRLKDAWQFVLRGHTSMDAARVVRVPLWKTWYFRERSHFIWRELVWSCLLAVQLFWLITIYEWFANVVTNFPINILDGTWCALIVGLAVGVCKGLSSFLLPTDPESEERGVRFSRESRGQLVPIAATWLLVYPSAHLLAYWLTLRQFALPHIVPALIVAPFWFIMSVTATFMSTFMATQWDPKLTRGRLIRRRQIPLRTIAFLDDAYQRGVLRKVGATYQFRHAILQDRLAEQWLASRRPWVRRRRPMLYARYDLAEVWASVGRPEKAEIELRAALAQSRRALRRGDQRPLWAWYVLTQALEDQDKADSARDELQQLLKVARRTRGGDAYWLTRHVWKALCINLLRARSPHARFALTEFREALQATGSQHEEVKADIAWAQRRLARLSRTLFAELVRLGAVGEG